MSDNEYNPFSVLKKAGLKLRDDGTGPKKAPVAPKPAPAKPADNTAEILDKSMFLNAMAGTTRLKSAGKTKTSAPAKKAASKTSAPKASTPAAQAPHPQAAAPEQPQQPVKQAPRPTAAPAPAQDEVVDDSLFMKAMQGVKPMDGTSGRDVPASVEPAPEAAKPADALSREQLRNLLHGEVSYQLEFADGYQHGYVTGLDPKIFNRLRAGSFPVEASLDMHGLTSEETVHELVDFVRKHYQLGHRTLHLVTGRGNNSPLGRSVLREEVQNWLTRDPLRRVVLAFVTAQPKHGGPGAVYVLLRKHKKSLGKVDWDMPLEGPDTF